MNKCSKVTISVQVFKNRLRLVWSFAGKRNYLYIGLPDVTVNRKAAEARARQIELDIATSNLDPSLPKYKPESAQCILGQWMEKYGSSTTSRQLYS